MPKAYSYIRFSTPEQSKGDSLRRQTELSKQWAEQHNLEFVESMVDEGISAFKSSNAERGKLGDFLSAIEAGLIEKGSYLLIESLDRMSRDELDIAFERFSKILRSGVTVVTLNNGKVFTPESAKELVSIIEALLIFSRAHEESATKGKRVAAAWANKRKAAREEKKPLTKLTCGWIELVDGAYQLHEEHSETVRQIISLTKQGLGARLVAKELMRQGRSTFRGSKVWNNTTVSKVLRNRALFGEYQPMKIQHVEGRKIRVEDGEPVQNYYPALITEAEFYQISAIRNPSGTHLGGRKGQGFGNLFTKLATCANCGANMTIVNKGKPPKGFKYIQCTDGRRGTDCPAPTMRYDKLEQRMLVELMALDYSKVMPNARQIVSERSQIEREVNGLKLQIDDLKTQITTLTDRLALLDDPTPVITALNKRQAELKQIEEQIKEKNHAITLLSSSMDNGEHVTSESQRLTAQVFARVIVGLELDEQPIAELRERLNGLFRDMITSLRIGKESVEITFKSGEVELLDMAGNKRDSALMLKRSRAAEFGLRYLIEELGIELTPAQRTSILRAVNQSYPEPKFRVTKEWLDRN